MVTWRQKRKWNRPHFHLSQFALWLSPSLSLSVSLFLSLSFADIECASSLQILLLDPSLAPQWIREPWEFSQALEEKKQLVCSCWSSSGVEEQQGYLRYSKKKTVIIGMSWMSLSHIRRGEFAVRCARCSQGIVRKKACPCAFILGAHGS